MQPSPMEEESSFSSEAKARAEDPTSDEIVLTIDEAVDRLGYGNFQRIILVAAGLCSASDAMEVLLLSFLAKSVSIDWDLSASEASGLISVVFVGAFVGTLWLGRLGDTLGRKPTFVLTAGIVAFFGLLTCLCQTYPQLLAARFCVGMGIGGVTIPFDTYGELLPSDCRGKGLVYPSYFWTTGTVLVALVAEATLGQDATRWRWLCFWSSLPCLGATLVGLWVVPESPRWLLSHQQNAPAALAILRQAAAINGLPADQIFPIETTILVATTTYSQGNDTTFAMPQTTSSDSNVDLEDETWLDEDEISSSSEARTNSSRVDSQQPNGLVIEDNYQPHRKDAPGATPSSTIWELLSPRWIRTSLAILVVWFCYAFLYYGSVLVVTNVFSSYSPTSEDVAKGEGEFLNETASSFSNETIFDDQAVDDIENSKVTLHFDYFAIILASLAEIAGATLVVLTIDRLGRKPMHALSFLLGGLLVISLCWAASSPSEESSPSVDTQTLSDGQNYDAGPSPQTTRRGLDIILAVLARMFIFCGSTITWVWTAELFTTEHRSTGHSLANAGARIGGFLAPYLVLVVSSSSDDEASSSNGTSANSRASYLWIGGTMLAISWIIVAAARILPETYGIAMGEAVLLQQKQKLQEKLGRGEGSIDGMIKEEEDTLAQPPDAARVGRKKGYQHLTVSSNYGLT